MHGLHLSGQVHLFEQFCDKLVQSCSDNGGSTVMIAVFFFKVLPEPDTSV